MTKNLANKVAERKFKVANDKINQTERNGLKQEVLAELADVLENAGYETFRTNDGVVMRLMAKNVEIFVAVDGVVKNLDYDLDYEISEYELKVAKQLERQKEREAKAKANAKK